MGLFSLLCRRSVRPWAARSCSPKPGRVDKLVGDGEAGELPIGIGVNSGTVIAGNVGGAGRLEFSVIDDPVNVAARMQEATRETGDTVLVTDHAPRPPGTLVAESATEG